MRALAQPGGCRVKGLWPALAPPANEVQLTGFVRQSPHAGVVRRVTDGAVVLLDWSVWPPRRPVTAGGSRRP